MSPLSKVDGIEGPNQVIDGGKYSGIVGYSGLLSIVLECDQFHVY